MLDLVVAVIFHVRFSGFGGVMVCVVAMTGRDVRVMAGCMVIPLVVVLCSLPVMAGRVLVMFGCLLMMLSG